MFDTIEKDGKYFVYSPLLEEQLTDEELTRLSEMFIRYGDITKIIEKLESELLVLLSKRLNLACSIKRMEESYIFVPNATILERILRSSDRLPDGYKDKLSKMREELFV